MKFENDFEFFDPLEIFASLRVVVSKVLINSLRCAELSQIQRFYDPRASSKEQSIRCQDAAWRSKICRHRLVPTCRWKQSAQSVTDHGLSCLIRAAVQFQLSRSDFGCLHGVW